MPEGIQVSPAVTLSEKSSIFIDRMCVFTSNINVTFPRNDADSPKQCILLLRVLLRVKVTFLMSLSPSYPALCRQDTTSPWSTDFGENNFCQTLIQMREAFFWEKEKKGASSRKKTERPQIGSL